MERILKSLPGIINFDPGIEHQKFVQLLLFNKNTRGRVVPLPVVRLRLCLLNDFPFFGNGEFRAG